MIRITRKEINPSQITGASKVNNFQGNLLDVLEYEIDFEIDVFSAFSGTDLFLVSNGIVTISDSIDASFSFIDDGFRVGMMLRVQRNAPLAQFADVGKIVKVEQRKLTLESTQTLNGGAPMEGVVYIESIDNIELQYSIRENFSGGIFNSLIDDTGQKFTSELVTFGDATPVNFQEVKIKSGVVVSDLELVNNNVGSHDGGANRVQEYTLTFNVLMAPLFDNSDDFFNDEIPDYFKDEESLGDKFLISAYFVENDPNTYIEGDFLEEIGVVGYYGENFNNKPSEYEITSVTYQENVGLSTVSALQSSGETRVTLTIETDGVNTIIDSDVKLFANVFYVPINDDQYKEIETPYKENIKFNRAALAGAPASVDTPLISDEFPTFGHGIKSIDAVKISDSNLRVILIYEAQNDFTDFLDTLEEGNKRFAIAVQIGDSTLTESNSDRVTLNPVKGEYVEPVFTGTGITVDSEYFTHPNVDANPEEAIASIIQDKVLGEHTISIDRSLGLLINSITFRIICINDSTSELFELESRTFSFDQADILPSGAQAYNFNSTRGFRLPDGDSKNLVTLNLTDETEANTTYFLQYAFAARWEDYIAKSDVDQSFYNTSEKNNGLNNDWSTKTNDDWSIYPEVIVSTNQGSFTERGLQATFIGFNTDGALSVHWTSGSIKTFKETPAPVFTQEITPDIMGTERTRIEVTAVSPQPVNIVDHYAVINLEEWENGGLQKIWELSSEFVDDQADNPLIPLDGQTKVLISQPVPPAELVAECLVDYTKLNLERKTYCITGKIAPKLPPEGYSLLFQHDANSGALSVDGAFGTTWEWRYELGNGTIATATGNFISVADFLNPSADLLGVSIKASPGDDFYEFSSNGSLVSIVGAFNASPFPNLRTLDLMDNTRMTRVFFNGESHTLSNLSTRFSGLQLIDLSRVDFVSVAPLPGAVINLDDCPDLGSAGGLGVNGYHVILPTGTSIQLLYQLRISGASQPNVNWDALKDANDGTLNLITLVDNNYTQEEIDDILVKIDNATPHISTAPITLNMFGVNAAPSAVGLAAKANLQARNWTVSTN